MSVRRGGALLAVVFVAACTAADPPAVAPAAASAPAPAPAPASASAPAPAPKSSAFSSWTDARAVDALAADCHAHSPAPPSEDVPDPLACRLPFDQSCAYDPCFDKHEDCRAGCTKTCTSCDAACAGTCDACAGGCRDDVCRRECATRAGACKQACLASLDGCASGACSQVSTACESTESAKWRSHKCSCKTIGPCMQTCLEHIPPGKSMWEKTPCYARCAARFPGCDTYYCLTGNGPSGGDATP